MQKNKIQLNSLVITILILIPLIVSCLPSSQASLINNVNFKEQHVSTSNPIFIAGGFQYFDVTLTSEAQKIIIIAYYQGDNILDPQDRSPSNYYRWEYDHGTWKDASGHDLSYIVSSKCSKEEYTYSFYLGIDNRAKPGRWTIRVIVDNKEVSSTPSFVVLAGFNFFLSSIIGLVDSSNGLKKFPFYQSFICSDRKRIMVESEKNIEEKVDEILKRQPPSDHEDKSNGETLDLFVSNEPSLYKEELVKLTSTTYPKSKLKNIQNKVVVSSFLDKRRGGKNGFWPAKFDGHKRFLALIITIIVISAIFTPIITSDGNNGGEPPEITIINVQSYPVIGGTWTVMFTTIGSANLTISAVNGTTWSNNDSDHDLQFIELKCGNETLQYEWINDSVFIENFSSNETCYETSQVITPGIHTLRFQFGDDMAYANNLASEYWLQTSTSDFNNGTKNNVNVSSNSFHLNETYNIQNTSLIDDESFEGSWLPTGWSEDPSTSEWNREGDQTYDGIWSADFDGPGGGAAGNLITQAMDCSDTANITAIYVSFYGRADGADNGDYYLDYYNGSSWIQIRRLDNFGVGAYAQYTDKIIDSQYFISDFQIRWRVVELKNKEYVYVDLVNVTLEKNISGYVTSGSLVSEAHDTGRNVPDYNNIVVDNSTPSGTTITTWVKAADSQANLSSATWYTDISQVPDERWVQWRINLTGDQYNTPTVNEVNLTWNYDDEKPSSSVNAITPYWQNSTPFNIYATASDTGGSGIKEVALYYNYSLDNASGWTGWTLFGTNDTTSPYSWSFTAPDGDGYYRFYSIAVDNESNTENLPSSPDYDNISGVDTADPISQVDDLSKYWYNEPDNPLTINVSSATDTLSGVKNVTLYYKYREDNSSIWGSWQSFGTDTITPWQWNFNFPDGAGHYAFYSIAADNASNYEDPPGTPDNDTHCGYITTKPSSEVETIIPYWYNSSPITITGQATDFSGSGLKNVTLYYYNSSDNNSWSGAWTYGVDTDPWVDISWSFNFLNGTGYYRFYSIAIDNNTNVEDFTGNDTMCGYDTSKPSSQIDNITPYWQNTSDNPLDINVSSPTDDLSGINNISLYHRYSSDNISWGGWVFFNKDENSPWGWSFTFSNGSGYYQFYSIANDTAGNKEDPPPENDTHCGYDTTDPSSQVDSISPYWKYESDNPLTIDVTIYSDDLSGIKNITLYYKYRADNGSSWGSWTSYGIDSSAPWQWSFTFPNSEGHYAFYSIAADNASNHENPPPDNDTQCGYELLTSFTTSLWSESNTVTAGLTLTSSTNADGSTTGTWADANGGWAQSPYEYWDFTIQDNTGLIGPITSVTLYLKHYQNGWSNDNFKIQIYADSGWQDVQSYSAGSGPPTSDTTNNWDVKIIGLDTWTDINAAVVRITGNGKVANEDTVRWYVDTVELRIVTQYVTPTINSYDLKNATGSKLNNIAGLIDVNKEYTFSINITDENGWADIDYINIKTCYDNGSDITTYNQTLGGNLNMFLQYENATGTVNWSMIWPDDEAQLISGNCTETIVNSTTRVINISFKPLSQVRWAGGDGAWDTTQNTTNDPYSWNFNITVIDAEGKENSKVDEYGVYKYTSVLPSSDWVDVLARPGSSDNSNVVTVTYSSNYDFNMSIYFEENLTNATWGDTISIAGNVTIRADADLNDDITTNKVFVGIGEANAIDIFNASGLFQIDGVSQTVDVQFKVYIPIGTSWGEYTARVATKIIHD